MATEITKWDEKMATMAEQYASGESVKGDFLSIKGGVLSFQDEPMPGNQMAVIILDVIRERTFYAEKYDASSEHNLPPVCYALARSEEDLAPHTSMQKDLTYFQPQNDVCATCPNNEWGSSDTGKGKACAERRRLAVLPAGYYAPKKGSRDFDLHLFDEAKHYEDADIAFLKLNVMSVKDWARYVTDLASSLRRPPVGVVTRVYVEPDPKSQFRVRFETIESVPDSLFDVLMARHSEAMESIEFGYSAPSAEAREARGTKQGVRR